MVATNIFYRKIHSCHKRHVYGVSIMKFCQNFFDEHNGNRELSVYFIAMHTPIKRSNIFESNNNDITVQATYGIGVFSPSTTEIQFFMYEFLFKMMWDKY